MKIQKRRGQHRRHLALGCLLVAVWAPFSGCGPDATDDDPGPSKDVVLSIESYPVGLNGAYSYFEQERLEALPSTYASDPPDVVCLSNVIRDEHKIWLEKELRATFPYAYWAPASLTDPPDDPTDQSGDVPPVPTDAPCTGALEQLARSSIECTQAHCSTIPSDPGGHVTRLSCASSTCAAEFVPLLGSDPEYRRCLSCLQAEITSYHSFGTILDRCLKDPHAGLLFDGTPSNMVFSRYPIVTSRARRWLLPSSLIRRQVLRVPVLVKDVEIDVFCLSFSTIYSGSLIVHPGPYGGGATGSTAWANEVLLQAEKTIAILEAEGEDRPMVVLGLDQGSKEFVRDGKVLVAGSEGAAVFDRFAAHLKLAVPEDHVPACTWCPENPLAGDEPPGEWNHHIWLRNDASVERASRNHMDRVVPVPTDPEVDVPSDGLIYASDSFGVRSVVRFPRSP